jgi:hypothetical protein
MDIDALFRSEQEYQSMITLATEGSTIGQRMGLGGEREIPESWEGWITAIQEGAIFPATLAEFIEKAKAALGE